ncbi:MAG: hypothetical protein IJ523_07370 [Succinivibrionaceae bacterium]|nr:hypothetical protein [Succinivibrionaceae bacterium]
MKRFIALMLTMLFLSVPVIAEEIDISTLDLSALLALHERLDSAIQDEIQCRLDENSIFQGVYAVGKDIASGYYLFTCIEDRHDEGNFDFFYEIYESQEAYDKNKRTMFDRFNVGESAQLDLQDGMVLRIVNGTANVQQSSKPAWAP